MKEKKWEILSKEVRSKDKGSITEEIIKILLKNRGIKTKKEIEQFFHQDISSVTCESVEINRAQLKKALHRIQKAIKKKEQIIIFGDYDVDGITGTAILWETIHALGANVLPYIPSRLDEGYGLSVKGIEKCIANQKSRHSELVSESKKNKIPHQATFSLHERSQVRDDSLGLIITVDNGIVANEAVDFANENGIDVIITDHHVVGKKLPQAHAIVHTTKVCGAGVAYLLGQKISSQFSVVGSQNQVSHFSVNQSGKLKTERLNSENGKQRTENRIPNDHLSLVALATLADLVPLTGANRILLHFGLEELRNTKRPGLLALFQEADIDPQNIGVYEIGHIIAPRLNAMGRLESAMDSLRLLCTKDRLKAKILAEKLGQTNKKRQLKTLAAVEHAMLAIRKQEIDTSKKLLFISHAEYEEGIIGLVAGRLVEEFYLPAIVLSKGEDITKASARSVAGFNIIEFIRSSSHLLVNAGGHPMAAGFTVKTINIPILQETLEKLIEEKLSKDLLQRVLKIDLRIPLEIITPEFFTSLQQLAPFGMANPEPTFVSTAIIEDIKTVGKENKHLRLHMQPHLLLKEEGNKTQVISMEAIAFGMGEKAKQLKVGDKVEIAYTIDENRWNGKVSLQLKIKDIKNKNKF